MMPGSAIANVTATLYPVPENLPSAFSGIISAGNTLSAPISRPPLR